jgi:hypothetical protein
VEISLHRRFPAPFGRLPNRRALTRSITFDGRQVATKDNSSKTITSQRRSPLKWILFPGGFSFDAQLIESLIVVVAAAIVTVVWGPRTIAR